MSEDPLKDQIITALQAITGRVEAIDAVLTKIDELDGSLVDKGARCEIESGMGSVTVDGHGRIIRVRLNPDSLETGDASKLGPRVLEAITVARRRALGARDAHIDDLVRKMWQ
ncbi:YbaB/EbfC family nucleoid-associated protein [Actinoallomurus sp. NBC_01490]|uniref:YbaB/EbfC family nucleoid-associated protein n=1 Tax=Actinoallomurus sp. NBC_01490 TaxID=2903557 RepID=UPI002E357F2B|nr:YbaB/EbfC family nucleoid-associated protein [Actinoallomurus sp. NBC_01490]